MNTSLFGELPRTIAGRGRALLDRGRDRCEMCGAIGAEEQYRVSLSPNRPLAKRESVDVEFNHASDRFADLVRLLSGFDTFVRVSNCDFLWARRSNGTIVAATNR